MAIVEKANVVLEIKDSEVERYLDLGYNVTDGKGNVLQACIPTDVGTLQKLYLEQLDTIESLKKQKADLEAKLKEATAKPKTTKAKAE